MRCPTPTCSRSSGPRALVLDLRWDVHGQHDVGLLGGARDGAAGRGFSPAVSAERTALARATGEVTVQALAAGLRPRDIMTRTAFLNAAAVVMATAGSTNAILHLLAIAHEAQVELSMDDFDVISRRSR